MVSVTVVNRVSRVVVVAVWVTVSMTVGVTTRHEQA
jgi:hypothetical protein